MLVETDWVQQNLGSDQFKLIEIDVDTALKFIFEESWSTIGDEFFRSLVHNLAGALG